MPPQIGALAYKMLGHSILLFAGLGVFTAIDFTHSVTAGSVLITAAIVVVAGIFTARSKIATIWREEAEGERAVRKRLERELAEEKKNRAKFDREQQEVRHDLKDEIVACKAQIKVMEAKTDLSAALDAIKQMNEHTSAVIADAMQHGSELSQRRDEETHRILGEIRDKLPSEPIEKADQPITVHEIGHDVTTE